jgi:outer membrane protein (TIGR04327 family)
MKLLLLFILLTQILFSQEPEKKEEPTPRRFNLNIKRMNYTYTPAEYYENKESTFSTVKNSGGLKNNTKNIIPMSLMYYHKDWNLFTEASFFKASFANMYYNQYFLPSSATHTNYTFGTGLGWLDNVLRNTMRQESKLNFYTSKEISESQSIFYGLGIRNINRETSRSRREFIYADRFDRVQSYGLNAYFKYQLQMFSFLKLKLSLEPFYTVGNRNRDSNYRLNTYYTSRGVRNEISFELYQKNPRNYFYGFETDLSLSFAIAENLNLNLGANFIYTKIRYENNKSYFANTDYAQSTNLFFLIQQELINKVPHESKDHLKGFYIGIDAKF